MRICLVCCELTADEDCICPECQAYVISESAADEASDELEAQGMFDPCPNCERLPWMCECIWTCTMCGKDEYDCNCEPPF